MIFTSFNFLIFFPLVTIIYWTLPIKYRSFFLLVASYFFYVNIKPVYLLLLAGISISTWLFTNLIEKASSEIKKKRYLVINITLILLPLLFFKYFGIINQSIFNILESYHLKCSLPEINLILPIGISFYTFMAIGYTVDVYNETVKAERNILFVSLFLSFFPLILCGPIERGKNMLPQFKNPLKFNYQLFVKGLKLMLWGYFMKLVVADRIGIYVDFIYDNTLSPNGHSLLLASFLAPFQIYTDFGGYSLIAIGTANVLGINIMQNFKRPFMATSISEFWRRWHISLIKWLTDYIYTPLSFSFRKLKIYGIVIALLITFIISGIWHGTALTYIIWGLLQGVFLSIDALLLKSKTAFENKYALRKKCGYIFLGLWKTFSLFSFSMIFGNVVHLQDAFFVFNKIFSSSAFKVFLVISFIVILFSALNLFIDSVLIKVQRLKYKRMIISIINCLFTLSVIVVGLHFFSNYKNNYFKEWRLTRNHATIIYSIFGLLIVLIKDIFEEFFPSRVLLFNNKYKVVRVFFYALVIILILLIGVLDGRQFIYFDF